jgi:hypothetical protein
MQPDPTAVAIGCLHAMRKALVCSIELADMLSEKVTVCVFVYFCCLTREVLTESEFDEFITFALVHVEHSNHNRVTALLEALSQVRGS